MNELINLRAETIPSFFVRKDFPAMAYPHDKIISIAPATNELHRRGQKTVQLLLGATAAARLMKFSQAYFDTVGAATAEVNCANFATYMETGRLDDTIAAICALDDLEGRIVEPEGLPRGAIGVIATSQDLHDPGSYHHFMHAGVSLGHGTWINVAGLRGDLAFSSIEHDMTYHRQHILPLYEPYNPGVELDPTQIKLYQRHAIEL
jgi:hypothetical protein